MIVIVHGIEAAIMGAKPLFIVYQLEVYCEIHLKNIHEVPKANIGG